MADRTVFRIMELIVELGRTSGRPPGRGVRQKSDARAGHAAAPLRKSSERRGRVWGTWLASWDLRAAGPKSGWQEEPWWSNLTGLIVNRSRPVLEASSGHMVKTLGALNFQGTS